MENFSTFQQKNRYFLDRTNEHIMRVQNWAKKIVKEFPEFDELLKEVAFHDASKFYEPEKTPYVEINWFYRMKARGIDYPYDLKLNDATFHHVKHNKHHPEYWDDNATEKCINSKDRDKPSGYVVDASKMPALHIAHMCADWMAMSEEKGGSPIDWAKSNIDVRWKFDEDQQKIVYNVLEKVWFKHRDRNNG